MEPAGGGTVDAADVPAVVDALSKVDLPEVPERVAKHMKSECAPVKYTFTWTRGGVR